MPESFTWLFVAELWRKVRYWVLGAIALLVLLVVAAGVAWGAERELRMVRPPAQMSMPCDYWAELVLWLAEMPESQRAGAVFSLRARSHYLYAFAVDAAKYLSRAQGELRSAALLECCALRRA